VSYVQASHLDVELEAQLRQAQPRRGRAVSPADHLQVGLPRTTRVSRAVAECRLGFG
jgi:hypothetical protein